MRLSKRGQTPTTSSRRSIQVLLGWTVSLLAHASLIAYLYEGSTTPKQTTDIRDIYLLGSTTTQANEAHPPPVTAPQRASKPSASASNKTPRHTTEAKPATTATASMMDPAQTSITTDAVPPDPTADSMDEQLAGLDNARNQDNTGPTDLADNAIASSSIDAAPTQAEQVAIANTKSTLVFDFYLGSARGAPLARVAHDLRVEQGRYEIKTSGEALGVAALVYNGLLTQTSRGRINAHGFQPEVYTEQRGRREPATIRIDHDARMIDWPEAKRRMDTSGEVIQDRITVAYQLGALVRERAQRDGFQQAQRSLRQGMDMLVVTNKQLERWRVRLMGEVTALNDEQPGPSWHFVRSVQEAILPGQVTETITERSQIEVWISPAHAWLPIQIKVVDRKGNSFLQRLNTIPPLLSIDPAGAG